MSVAEREIVRQAPVHTGMKIADDDRWHGRWVMNMGAPISLAEYSGSRFIGKFAEDVLPAKRPVFFAPHMARSLGVYEHRAHVGDLSSMATSVVDEMMSVPINAPQIGSIDLTRQAPLSQYDNNPKWCAYILMRDNERRGLILFEEMRGASAEEFNALLDLIVPPEIEAEWAKTKRVVLDHEFRGPFLDQYKTWLNTPRRAAGQHLDARQRVQLTAMNRELKAGVNRAWSWANSVLNTTEQQIRRYRNGHRGKEFYDMPDERMSNPVPPLDLICLADTGRQPIDLTQVAAANEQAKATNDGLVTAMESFGEKFAAKMQPGVSAPEIEAIIARRLSEQREEWERDAQARWDEKLAELKTSEN